MTSAMNNPLFNSHDRSYAGIRMRAESATSSRGRTCAPKSSYCCSLA